VAVIPDLGSFPPATYIGIEIEINQAIVVGPRRRWAELRAVVIESFRIALAPR
jgi:hypothetical protein